MAGGTTSGRCGAVVQPDGATLFRVWAPRAKQVNLVLQLGEERRTTSMVAEQSTFPGYFSAISNDAPPGTAYWFQLDDGPLRPDPCSLSQPDGVHAASAVVDLAAYRWNDSAWKGVDRSDLVIYELHVGTFAEAGDFESVIPRLAELRNLGVTAIEIMPVAQFPGTRNWGYDGVYSYAVQNSYGGPLGSQRLVDACHQHGLAVILDVVYNHFGPEGNYLSEFGHYFTDHYRTPWGTAVNFDGRNSGPVRDFVLANARMWLNDFHFDGLRLDAVHAIYDLGPYHILAEIQDVANEVSNTTSIARHIVAESDMNDPRLLLPQARGGYELGMQWSDDFHHAVHSVLANESQGYYEDFGDVDHLAQVLESPFLYAGQYSKHRGRCHGKPPEGLSGDRFVVSIQNHDQVGNRAQGDRFGALLEPAAQRLAATLLLLSPHIPMMFMGDEYGEARPFLFFCSFESAELIHAVREGRSSEFAAFKWQGEVPDPHSEATFEASKLSWSWPEGSTQAGMRRLYRDLLVARRTWPAMRDFERRQAKLLRDVGNGHTLQFIRGEASDSQIALTAYLNLSPEISPLPTNAAESSSDSAKQQLLFSSEAGSYGGRRASSGPLTELLPWECIVLGSQQLWKPGQATG